jgi:amino acid transporter
VWASTSLVVGVTIGSGIFRSPSVVADRVPDAVAVLGLWAAGGLIALCGALSLAELAAALPQSGGYYVYLREGWGRLAGFLFGWAQLVLIRASAIGGIAIVFGEYALRTIGIDPVQHSGASRALAAGAIAFAAAVNIRGVRLGAAIVGLSTVGKFAALLVIILSALLLGGARGASEANLVSGSSTPLILGNLGLALVSVLWAYDGFGDLSFAGGEVREPQRTLPRAIILGTLIIIALYLLANVAYLYVQPVEAVAQSPLIAADTMAAVFGQAGTAFVSLAVAVSTFGALNAITLASPRVFFAMAADGLLFPKVASVHPRYHTPHIAILLSALLGVALALSRSFEAVTSTFVLAVWPFYALSVAAVYRLRWRRPDLPRPYRAFGYPIVPAVFIASVLWFVGNALVNEPRSTMLTFALIGAGAPVYFVAFGRQRYG